MNIKHFLLGIICAILVFGGVICLAPDIIVFLAWDEGVAMPISKQVIIGIAMLIGGAATGTWVITRSYYIDLTRKLLDKGVFSSKI